MKKHVERRKKIDLRRHVLRGALYALVTLLVCSCTAVGFFVVQGKKVAKQESAVPVVATIEEKADQRFPVGVNPARKEITENPLVETYFKAHIAESDSEPTLYTSYLRRALGQLALFGWYQNMASLSTRILVILSGERKEEVAQHFGRILGWDETEKNDFAALITGYAPELTEGKFFPGTYTVQKGATPEEVAPLIGDAFNAEVLSRYDGDVASMVPLQDALTIASLLEREAYDFSDMRHISGVIWNRLFTGMPLQIDATLQYAKGSSPYEAWWPRVYPADKYIASAYNTYRNEGLPPAPIANPSLDAILAALNPKKTDCMYYFHDRDAGFHCTPTYKEHVELLKQYYGRGK
jgi:cell division protein YceG involved in septum cleavage